jgi:hypothetical protein
VDQGDASAAENIDHATVMKPSDLQQMKSRQKWIIGISSAFIFPFALVLLILIFLSELFEEKKPGQQPGLGKSITHKIPEMRLSDMVFIKTDGSMFTLSEHADPNEELLILRMDVPKIAPTTKINPDSEKQRSPRCEI